MKIHKFPEPIKLDLGCGKWKKKGFIGIDNANLENVDIVYNLEKGIPFPDESVSYIYTSHFMEHIEDPIKMLEEMYRVLNRKGIVEIHVPHWTHQTAHTFLHKSYWSSETLMFFQKGSNYEFYSSAKFDILERKLIYTDFAGRFTKWISHFLTWILNKNLNFSEKFLIRFIAPFEIKYILRKREE